MNKKIIILTASYWAGHNIAAKTLSDFYSQKWYEIKLVDLVDFIDVFIWKTTQNFYQNFCSKYPTIWWLTFSFLDIKIIKNIIFWFKLPFYQNKFDKIISEYEPNIVLSVFPFWWLFIKHNIINYDKKYKTWIIVTDSIKIHSIWYLWWNYIDKYFLIDKYSKKEFIKKFNHKKNNLIVSFFPIEKKYFLDKTYINDKNITILLTWLKKEYINTILTAFIDTDYKITIIKWRNTYLFNEIKDKFNYNNFEYLNFVNLREFYSKIGIFIWKPWWAIVCECIWTDTPIIIANYIPWQEEWNIELINRTWLWLYEKDASKVKKIIESTYWSSMLYKFKIIKKKDSLELIYNSFNT